MKLRAKTIDEFTNSEPGTFNKHLKEQQIIERAGELWRKINIYTARKPLNSRTKDFQCPKCNNNLVKINWAKNGMFFRCLDKNCKFEYPN